MTGSAGNLPVAVRIIRYTREGNVEADFIVHDVGAYGFNTNEGLFAFLSHHNLHVQDVGCVAILGVDGHQVLWTACDPDLEFVSVVGDIS